MEKLFISICTVVFANIVMQAQQQTTVNVRLYPIQTLVVNGNQKNVNLDYHTKADYANGVSVEQKDHLQIYSTGGFSVHVRSESPTLTSQQPLVTESIAASDLIITAKSGDSNPLSDAVYSTAGLSTSPEKIIESSTGGINRTVTVEYKAQGNLDAYINKHMTPGEATVYSAEVIYEIIAQ